MHVSSATKKRPVYFDRPVDNGGSEWRKCIATLAKLPDEELGKLDIAELNLLCALGLPGAEGFDKQAALQTIDDWTALIGASIEKWRLRFDRTPGEFNHCFAQFQILAMVTVLNRDIGVGYNLAFIEGEYNGSDSRNLFIHGMLGGHGGTCATMPVLYIAIGRRLGFPLYLVQAKEHYFVRWQDSRDRFNIEATSVGFEPRDDAHFRTWPKPLTDSDLATGMYLRNFRPREVMGGFLCQRGHCLFDNLRIGEAILALQLAAEFAQHDPNVQAGWAITSALFHALVQAEIQAFSSGRDEIDLRTVRLPEPENERQRSILLSARRELDRVIGIHSHSPIIPVPLR